MTQTPSRTDFHAKYQPYWSAPTSKLGLKRYYRRQIPGDTRTCAWCEQEFDLEEFWSDFKYGWACSSDRTKAHKNRKQVEQEVAGGDKDQKDDGDQDNRDQGDQDQSDQDQDDQDQDDQDGDGKGPVGAVKDKVTHKAKQAGAKVAGAAAGKVTEKVVSSAGEKLIDEQSGKALGKQAGKATKRMVQKSAA